MFSLWYFYFLFFPAQDGIRAAHYALEFTRVLFRSRSTDPPLPSTTRRHVALRLVGEARRSADRASAIQSELDAAASTAATTTSRSSSPNSRAISSMRS